MKLYTTIIVAIHVILHLFSTPIIGMEPSDPLRARAHRLLASAAKKYRAKKQLKAKGLAKAAAEAIVQNKLSIDQAEQKCSEKIDDILRALVMPNSKYRFDSEKLFVKFDWLPGYLIKTDESRVVGAEEILRPCIEKYNLNLLGVPQKRRCPIPDEALLPNDLKNYYRIRSNTLCVVEYIQGTQQWRWTLAQTQQMVTLLTQAEKTFVDCVPQNFVCTPQGKVFIIDTEAKWIKAGAGQDGLCNLYVHNQFEPEARTFLDTEIKRRYPNADIGRYVPWRD